MLIFAAGLFLNYDPASEHSPPWTDKVFSLLKEDVKTSSMWFRQAMAYC